MGAKCAESPPGATEARSWNVLRRPKLFILTIASRAKWRGVWDSRAPGTLVCGDLMVTWQLVDASLPLRFSRQVSYTFSSVWKNFHVCKLFFYKPPKPNNNFLDPTIFFETGLSNLPLTTKQLANTNISVLEESQLIN